RITQEMKDEASKKRLLGILESADSLALSAGLLRLTAAILFTLTVLGLWAGRDKAGWADVWITLCIAAPCIALFGEVLPQVFARRYGDGLLRGAVPALNVLLFPLRILTSAMLFVRRTLESTLGLPEHSASTRAIIEELREVIADSGTPEGLDEHEKELIENVIEFKNVDVAAVMTPRTEIHGCEVGEGLLGAVQVAAESGHSRIPIYEDSLDSIIGTVTARDVIEQVSQGTVEGSELREVMHPAYFVPETKLVAEMLAVFRREKLKLAIVLDEYGGTAGIVTLGDVLEEIVGVIHEEHREEETALVQLVREGVAEVDASMHVTDVNEELDLELPEEEDFETLGGYVLSELGHLPKEGEKFVRQDVTYRIVEASDRRVIKVRVERAVAS
ncbi:MAG: hemolysin family protein, partial [Planctomycetota bacterium]